MNLTLDNINDIVSRVLPNYLEIKESYLKDETGGIAAIYTVAIKSNAKSSNNEVPGIGHIIQYRIREYWSPSELLINLDINGPDVIFHKSYD